MILRFSRRNCPFDRKSTSQPALNPTFPTDSAHHIDVQLLEHLLPQEAVIGVHFDLHQRFVELHRIAASPLTSIAPRIALLLFTFAVAPRMVSACGKSDPSAKSSPYAIAYLSLTRFLLRYSSKSAAYNGE